ncbi:MAG: hypothetical protein ACQES8_03370 [Thermodesulfobacteriota bacterium]
MKHLSFRVLFLCVFLPPVLYIFTIQGLEALLQRNWESELRGRLITNPQELLAGRKKIQKEIGENVQDFLKSLRLLKFGPRVHILVRTGSGRVIYPAVNGEGEYDIDYAGGLSSSPDSSDRSRVAEDNLQILEESLQFSLQVSIPRNTWLANTVLLFYIMVFTAVLYSNYRSRAKTIDELNRRKEQDLEDVRERLTKAQSRLQDATVKEQAYREKIDKQQHDLIKVDRLLQSTEEEALAEMEALEEKLQKSMTQKQEQEQEIDRLLQKVEKLESVQQAPPRKRNKQHEDICKRFKVLYKNIDFHDRALEGFLQLPKDLELKAEEMVQALNQDYGLVKVKRKVFSGKGSDLPALESIFAYRGRIYWRKNADARIEIMAVGTKNTQNKDLGYLERISRSS